MNAFLAELQRRGSLESRPVFRRIVDLCADIEHAMRSGYTRTQIVRALRVEGIDISEAMLSSYLHRIRKIRRGQAAGDDVPVTPLPALDVPEPLPPADPPKKARSLWPF